MSATDELRRLLDERGVEYETDDRNGLRETIWCGTAAFQLSPTAKMTMIVTPEQAIAATLGNEPPYDELLGCLENDWHVSASWDGLRKFWCIELTEDGVRLRDATRGTLTAEQVREAIEANSWAETSTIREFNDSSWQAIADELNSRAERTCHIVRASRKYVLSDGTELFDDGCSECNGYIGDGDNYCSNCGARVVSE